MEKPSLDRQVEDLAGRLEIPGVDSDSDAPAASESVLEELAHDSSTSQVRWLSGRKRPRTETGRLTVVICSIVAGILVCVGIVELLRSRFEREVPSIEEGNISTVRDVNDIPQYDPIERREQYIEDAVRLHETLIEKYAKEEANDATNIATIRKAQSEILSFLIETIESPDASQQQQESALEQVKRLPAFYVGLQRSWGGATIFSDDLRAMEKEIEAVQMRGQVLDEPVPAIGVPEETPKKTADDTTSVPLSHGRTIPKVTVYNDE